MLILRPNVKPNAPVAVPVVVPVHGPVAVHVAVPVAVPVTAPVIVPLDIVLLHMLFCRSGGLPAGMGPLSSGSQSEHPAGSRMTPQFYLHGPKRRGLKAVVARGSLWAPLSAKV